jgi:hypothetical protein
LCAAVNEPNDWLSNISRATWTLLLAALALFIAWQAIRQVLPALLIVGALLAIYKLAIGRYRHF